MPDFWGRSPQRRHFACWHHHLAEVRAEAVVVAALQGVAAHSPPVQNSNHPAARLLLLPLAQVLQRRQAPSLLLLRVLSAEVVVVVLGAVRTLEGLCVWVGQNWAFAALAVMKQQRWLWPLLAEFRCQHLALPVSGSGLPQLRMPAAGDAADRTPLRPFHPPENRCCLLHL